MNNGIIISIGNNKGGVGKTSISCNLAVALSRLGSRVLVVDMDSQCNASSILMGSNLSPNYTLYELLDPGNQSPAVLTQHIYATGHDNVWCLPNTEESSALDIPLGKLAPDSFSILRTQLRSYAQSNFDFTLIDNPPSIGLWLSISLYASDFAIVPIDAGSGNSLEGLRRVLELINSIREHANPDLRFLRLVINRVELRTSVSRQVINLVKSRFQHDQYFETQIPKNTAIQQAEFLKQTIFEHDQASRAAKSYRTLAKELHEIYEQLEHLPSAITA
jgi:chromosome partitioning protein